MTELAERLGFSGDDRILLINCDDLGMSQSTNDAVYDALRTGTYSRTLTFTLATTSP